MDTIRTARAGAVVCIVGAVGAVVFALALLGGFQPADESPFLLPVYVANLAGVIALALTGAAAGRIGQAGLGIAFAGMVGFFAAEITAPGQASALLYAVVPLVTALGLVLAGVAVLRSGRWSGWRRYVPLVAGAWVVIVVVPLVALIGDPGPGGGAAVLAAIGAWHLLWAALGSAVLAETRTREHRPGRRSCSGARCCARCRRPASRPSTSRR